MNASIPLEDPMTNSKTKRARKPRTAAAPPSPILTQGSEPPVTPKPTLRRGGSPQQEESPAVLKGKRSRQPKQAATSVTPELSPPGTSALPTEAGSTVLKRKRNRKPTPAATPLSSTPAGKMEATVASELTLKSTSALSPAVRSVPALQEKDRANVTEALETALRTIDGALATALVDYGSGRALGMLGSGINLEAAALGNTAVVQAKMRTMELMGIAGSIEDILITLETQYHILYIVPTHTLFMYLVLDKDQANLALARFKLRSLTHALMTS